MRKILFMVASFALALKAMAVEPITAKFLTVDGAPLEMDVYLPEAPSDTPRQAVVFAFGGGFTHGERNDPRYLEFFQFLADNGIVAISTDYRTVLADAIPAGQQDSPKAFALALGTAIETAVSDFYVATAFVVKNSKEWNIDPSKIVAAGSSAGAITALQTEYLVANGVLPEGPLPSHFNYAGVISFAGAICSNGPIGWSKAPCPMMLFHGTADSNVPYRSISVGQVSLNGSDVISQSLGAVNVPCEFYSVEGADHGVAISPMHDNLYDILGFLRRIDTATETLSRNVVELKPGEAVTPPPAFTIGDYIRANMN